MKKIKVVLVDDHVLFSNALKKLIDSFQDFKVVAQVTNGEEYIQLIAIQDLSFDILLLDVKMPVMDGIQTMTWIKKNQPEVPVLVLSIEDDDLTIIKMLKLGAKGYILKDIDPDEFNAALRIVASNNFYHSEKTSALLLNQLVTDGDNARLNLKEREIEFLNLICSELTYKEIASKMHLSPKTIDGYRENLFRKTGVKSRTGLVLFAIKSKIISI